MNKYQRIFKVGSLFLVSFLFTTPVLGQSFLEKTLKVVDAVEKISRANKATEKQENAASIQVHDKMETSQGFRVTAPFQDLSFKVRSCTIAGSTVTLELSIRNRAKNQHFLFGGDDRHVRTIMVDDRDNSYDYEKIKISIGDKPAEVTQAELFPTHVPIKMHIYLNEVEPSAKMITMLTLRVEGFDTPITFYNIPIEHPALTAAVSAGQSSAENMNNNVVSLTDRQESAPEASELEMIIGKWRLTSLKKDGKEQSFQPFALQFCDTPKDDPYNKDLIEILAGKAEKSGYTIIGGHDNQLVMCFPSITEDEEDNSYTIHSVDDETLVLTFSYYGVPGTDGVMTFKRE